MSTAKQTAKNRTGLSGEPSGAPPPAPGRSHGRRALLLGAAGTGAGITASLVTGAAPAQAAPAAGGQGTPVLLGDPNPTTGTTAVGTTSGTGLQGSSSDDVGVRGITTAIGTSGVSGHDNSPSGTTGNGTAGSSVNGTGVAGNSSHGTGVAGSGTIGVSGVGSVFGVSAQSPAGIALQVQGTVQFDRSGITPVAKGDKSVTVSPAGVFITAATFILATMRSSSYQTVTVDNVNIGIGVATVVSDVPADSFTIYLTAPATADAKIAWFVIG
jgi:hypothetical protein